MLLVLEAWFLPSCSSQKLRHCGIVDLLVFQDYHFAHQVRTPIQQSGRGSVLAKPIDSKHPWYQEIEALWCQGPALGWHFLPNKDSYLSKACSHKVAIPLFTSLYLTMSIQRHPTSSLLPQNSTQETPPNCKSHKEKATQNATRLYSVKMVALNTQTIKNNFITSLIRTLERAYFEVV